MSGIPKKDFDNARLLYSDVRDALSELADLLEESGADLGVRNDLRTASSYLRASLSYLLIDQGEEFLHSHVAVGLDDPPEVVEESSTMMDPNNEPAEVDEDPFERAQRHKDIAFNTDAYVNDIPEAWYTTLQTLLIGVVAETSPSEDHVTYKCRNAFMAQFDKVNTEMGVLLELAKDLSLAANNAADEMQDAEEVAQKLAKRFAR